MEWLIVSLIFAAIIILFVSPFISRKFSAFVFTMAFLAVATFMVIKGNKEDIVAQIMLIGLFLTAAWLRLNVSIERMQAARRQYGPSDPEYNTCKVCGGQLEYHAQPKRLRQFPSGGFTCQNCGAEVNVPFGLFLRNIRF